MSVHTREVSGNGAVYVFHDSKFSGEEDVKEALFDLVIEKVGPSVGGKWYRCEGME